MIRKSIITIMATMLLAIAGCNASDQNKNVVPPNTNAKGKTVHINTTDFKQLVFNFDKNKQWKYEGKVPAIVDFYANWCGPCRMVAPILEELAKEYDGKIVIYKVNTDEERELSQTLGISSLPTLVFIPVEGAPQAILGAQPKENLIKAINEILLTNNKK